jgi:hypothetical protein
MHSPLALVVSVLCILFGAFSFSFPRTLSHFQEDAETSPGEAVWQIRIGGGFLFLFGCALLHSILTWDGQPVEFIGV